MAPREGSTVEGHEVRRAMTAAVRRPANPEQFDRALGALGRATDAAARTAPSRARSAGQLPHVDRRTTVLRFVAVALALVLVAAITVAVVR